MHFFMTILFSCQIFSIQARTSHTELLDLKPFLVSSVWDGTYEALYNFSHFNPVQMQIFHILYHTDNNVLLGAPTGSWKTMSTVLAMLPPLKAIVGERMNDWRKHHVTQLGKTMLEMTGDYTPDVMALLSADIIISTPEKWDGISRNWHRRSYVTKVGLVILDEIHLLGVDRGPILEFATSDEHPRQFLSVTGEVLQTVLSQVTDQNLRHTVRFGIGLHHAAYTSNKKSDYLFTSVGVYLYTGMGSKTAHSMINMEKLLFLFMNPKSASIKRLGVTIRLVGGSNCMHEHINAEIAMGTICHKKDAMHYLAWTCLFRRLV
ncbi:hypothetical protein SADUNF_Sadunf15G0044500 [Salix dunnii]|uniref:Helicase ATP-binding domain-containing protein n=1 Tax=Salix dunnii TaxID=1413687 RepID=A0A835JAJ9_9ROSI|nr:hypothetical protein SADUNF_Sadunf15G0044500 [Salix dunnii]